MTKRFAIKRALKTAPAICLAAVLALTLCGWASRTSFAATLPPPQTALDAAHTGQADAEEDPHTHGTHIDPPLNEYDDKIGDFVKDDKVHPHAKACTLFLGSSTFAMWTKLERRFKQFGAINRGFGGATIKEITHYADKIVYPYQPCRIVFYAGTNDIFDNHTPAEVYQDFLDFENAVRIKYPDVELFYISMSTPPSRVHWQKQYDESNRLIYGHMVAAPHDHWIEVRDLTRDKRGRLKMAWFRKDRTHMKDIGYRSWEPRIRKALLDDVRVHSTSPATKKTTP